MPSQPRRTRVLVVTLDTIADQMAGPAIRAWEMARALSLRCDVMLATFGRCDRAGVGFVTRTISAGEFRGVVQASDVVVLQGYVGTAFPWLRRCEQVIVVDLYDPYHLEALASRGSLDERRAGLGRARRELSAQMSRGDWFLCASDKQRDFWLGHLAAAGRVNPETFDADPSLHSLITVVPFGLNPTPPRPTRPAIRGVIPGIASSDPVVLWAGGVYDWFDPLTLVRAIDQVRVDVPNVRLVFLGMTHPNPTVPETTMAAHTRALADDLGLTGRNVIFNEAWVPYEERANYLADADIGVSCHLDQIETAFSFRTRILDYLWAGLPVVCTAGDTFADLVTAENLGRVAPAGDASALAAALRALLTDDAVRSGAAERVRAVAPRYTWPTVLEPLVDFCAAPRRAADAQQLQRYTRRRSRLGEEVTAVRRNLREGGLRQVAQKASALVAGAARRR